jgi:TonB family protein
MTIILAMAITIILAVNIVGGETDYPSDTYLISNLYCSDARNHAMKGDYDKALEFADEALEYNPGNIEAIFARGSLRSYRGEFKKALKDLKKVKRAAGKDSEFLFNRGMVYALMGEYKKAAADLSSAWVEDDSLTIALYNCAIANEKRGKWKIALKDYILILDSMPNFDEGYIAIAKDRIDKLRDAIEANETPPGVEELKFTGPYFYDRTPMGKIDEKINEMIPVTEFPVQIYEETPEYPFYASEQRRVGYVIVQAYLSRRGFVEKAIAAKCSSPKWGFEEAALRAAYQCQYLPAKINGKPVELWIEYKVNFTF